MALILASGSPRRRELMSLITPDYTVITSDVDETKIAADSPAHLAKALATAKARAVAEENPDDVVCGFDTVVECEGEVFGKPKDEADAVRIEGCYYNIMGLPVHRTAQLLREFT